MVTLQSVQSGSYWCNPPFNFLTFRHSDAILNALVDSFLPQSEKKCGTERVKAEVFGLRIPVMAIMDTL